MAALALVRAIEPLESRTLLTVYTVTTTADAGSGSLRQALLDANSNPGADEIHFGLAAGSILGITPATDLPEITGPVTLDATTQPGYAGSPLIGIIGPNTYGSQRVGVRVKADGCVIRGLAIDGFSTQMRVDSNGNRVEACWLGITAGAADLTNPWDAGTGLRVYGDDNTIGGTVAAARNVISGNHNGMSVGGERNVVRGNYIGVDPTGTKPLPNSSVGVYLTGDYNVLGGTVAGARNVIANHASTGVAIESGSSSWNVVQGNLIGSDPSGTLDWRNGSGIVIRGVGNRIGGEEPGAGNLIPFSRSVAVAVSPPLGASGSYGNTIVGNSMGYSQQGSILLWDAWGNDFLDADDGANRRQNYPVLRVATSTAERLRILGSLDSAPSSTYRLHFYAGPSATTYLGFASVTTDALGHADFDLAIDVAPADDSRIVATATDAEGNTSQLSSSVRVSSSVLRVTTDADAGAGSLRQAITAANAEPGPNLIEFDIPEGGSGAHRITIAAPLPEVTEAIFLDGTTQPGYAGSPKVELAGDGTFDGLHLKGTAASSSVIAGLAVGGFSTGIVLGGATAGELVHSSIVAGCLIGLDAGGAPLPNQTGVRITGSSNLIGGLSPADRNVISANLGAGVRLASSGFDNAFRGNLIGTDVAGAAPLGNDVGIDNQGIMTVIGGPVAQARNVISGNRSAGLYTHSPNVEPLRSGSSAIVSDTYFGTNAAGTAPVPNGVGIVSELEGADIRAGVVVSGNVGAAVVSRTGILTVNGAYIGTDAAGQNPLPNGGHGIELHGTWAKIVSSLIAFNGGDGISYERVPAGGASSTFTVRENRIHSNAGMAIDLGDDGPTPNDPGGRDDQDTGLTNHPQLTRAVRTPAGLYVFGFRDSAMASDVELHLSLPPGPSGRGESLRLLAADRVGPRFALFVPAGVLPAFPFHVSALVTNYDVAFTARTSEFSDTLMVTGEVFNPPPGDANLDGVVDFADLVALAQNYNQTNTILPQGDFTGDRVTDFSDLVVLAQNYNAAARALESMGSVRPASAETRQKDSVFSKRPVAAVPPAKRPAVKPKVAGKRISGKS